MKKRVSFLFVMFFYFHATAEYRVFSLLIAHDEKQTYRQIQTTLDPEQFTTLYPLALGERISYIDTWLCKGRTDGFREHCANPNLDTTNPAQQDQGPVQNTPQSPEVLQ